jgi:glutamate-1-semialdehyde 2,1-aminomutase
MKFDRSTSLFKEANKYLVGGVNSPVRAFKAVGGSPIFISKAKGSRIYDVDRNCYIDYVMSWGALILGHSHPSILTAVKNAISSGMSFGAPTEKEIELAKIISSAIPSIEMLRLVNSGTEATMSAIRLSRGYTEKNKIIKFEGCYHGHCDSLLVKAGSGAATFGTPDSAGVPESLSRDTIVCPYNDIDTVSRIIKEKHKEIACCIVEPVAANMGVVLPKIGFLANLRHLTTKYKIVLIFDEVICGFRFSFGGVQSLFGIEPDLTCLGKIIGGGLPLAAYGGKRKIMENLSPVGKVYQAGTLSGNPIAVSAGIVTLKVLSKMDYIKLNEKTSGLCLEMEDILKRNSLRFSLNRAGSMFTIFFTDKKVFDFRSAKLSDKKKYARYFWSMLKNGINLPPSQFEANFISFAHSEQDLEATVEAFKRAVKAL